jgi:hypothetical protein
MEWDQGEHNKDKTRGGIILTNLWSVTLANHVHMFVITRDSTNSSGEKENIAT